MLAEMEDLGGHANSVNYGLIALTKKPENIIFSGLRGVYFDLTHAEGYVLIAIILATSAPKNGCFRRA